VGGLLFFTLLLIVSFIVSSHSITFLKSAPQFMKDSTGRLVATTPYTPSQYPPMGTNGDGTSVFYQVLDGAKYSIAIVLGLTTIQVTIALLLGGVLANFKKSFFTLLEKITIYYYLIPKFMWVAMFWPLATTEISQIFLIAIALLPPLIVTLTKEIRLILDKEFIESVHVLGGGKWYIFVKHVWINIRSQLILLFIQQAVQTLTLIMHLAIFKIIIGGAVYTKDIDILSGELQADWWTVNINEWASLLSVEAEEFFIHPWMTISPLFMITLSIFVLNIMGQGFKSKNEAKQYSLLD
jgi:peptide/nickel transport system permease protein